MESEGLPPRRSARVRAEVARIHALVPGAKCFIEAEGSLTLPPKL